MNKRGQIRECITIFSECMNRILWCAPCSYNQGKGSSSIVTQYLGLLCLLSFVPSFLWLRSHPFSYLPTSCFGLLSFPFIVYACSPLFPRNACSHSTPLFSIVDTQLPALYNLCLMHRMKKTATDLADLTIYSSVCSHCM